ncbi:MAG: histidinol-phosphate transaminase [Gammaproteobacteria bacterium]|nr:MAG: histidinol-phosphate transaminase [Gammaproteobacteria bacterium]
MNAVDFHALANPGVAGLAPYQPGKPVEELERELGIADAVKLASNENPLGPPPAVRALLAEARIDPARYPDGNGFRLKRALAERLGIAMERITLGNGSNDVLDLVARVFLQPGRSAVFSEHAFAVYPIVTRAAGAEAIVTPARDYGHDLEAMRAAIRPDTRVVFLANPNNPTGTWLDAASLEAFLASVPPDVIVVLDEAYVEYVELPDYPDSLPWLDRHPNLVVTRTFSKVYGLAGLRVGYALSSAPVADLLNRVRQPFNVNALALEAAVLALEDEAHVRRSVALNREGMQFWERRFTEMGLSWIPSIGNFVTVDLGRPAAPVHQALLREGVIVRPVAAYGLPNHLRISIGLPEENARAAAALQKVLA